MLKLFNNNKDFVIINYNKFELSFNLQILLL